jgi:hypothetical protein
VEEQHPRKRSFMTSTKLSQLRNELYELLHDEIRRTMDIPSTGSDSPADDIFASDDGGKA